MVTTGPRVPENSESSSKAIGNSPYQFEAWNRRHALIVQRQGLVTPRQGPRGATDPAAPNDPADRSGCWPARSTVAPCCLRGEWHQRAIARPCLDRGRCIRELMAEMANDENNHVTFIRRAIKGRLLVEMSRPAIDFTAACAAVVELAGLGAGFDPFADEESFLLGAFLFEDVGVSAYTGAAKRVSNDIKLAEAAGIVAVEANHAGIIRAQIAEIGPALIEKANTISYARDTLDGEVVAEAPTPPAAQHLQHRRQRHRRPPGIAAGAEHRLRRLART